MAVKITSLESTSNAVPVTSWGSVQLDTCHMEPDFTCITKVRIHRSFTLLFILLSLFTYSYVATHTPQVTHHHSFIAAQRG